MIVDKWTNNKNPRSFLRQNQYYRTKKRISSSFWPMIFKEKCGKRSERGR